VGVVAELPLLTGNKWGKERRGMEKKEKQRCWHPIRPSVKGGERRSGGAQEQKREKSDFKLVGWGESDSVGRKRVRESFGS